MKRKPILFLPTLVVMIVLGSCGLISEAVPDVDTKISNTYQITINSSDPSGMFTTSFIEIQDNPDFAEYDEYITGYAINKITYEIIKYNAPEDLYFSGSVLAYDKDSITVVNVGEISSVNLLEISNLEGASEVPADTEATEQIVSWLDDPGTFNFSFTYDFENQDGTPYVFSQEEFGSSFSLKATLYLALLTGI